MIQIDIVKKYKNAEIQFIPSGLDNIAHGLGLGGMRDTHLPISYYLVASNPSGV